MLETTSNGSNTTSTAIIHALSNAIQSLEDYPHARDAFEAAEKKALTEEKWMPDMVNALLLTLKAQKTMLKTLKMEMNTEKSFEEIERTALHAIDTIIRIAKVDPCELRKFLHAKRKFCDAYNELLETPLDNLNAIQDFISAEIAVLENKELKEKAIYKAHKAIVKAIKAAIVALEEYPDALQAFLTAEKAFLQTRQEDTLTWPLLDSHILLLKTQKAMLHILDYNAPKQSFESFAEAAIRVLNSRQQIYRKLQDSPAKQKIEESLQAFREEYHRFFSSPVEHLQSFKDFLDAEIARFEGENITESLPELESV